MILALILTAIHLALIIDVLRRNWPPPPTQVRPQRERGWTIRGARARRRSHVTYVVPRLGTRRLL